MAWESSTSSSFISKNVLYALWHKDWICDRNPGQDEDHITCMTLHFQVINIFHFTNNRRQSHGRLWWRTISCSTRTTNCNLLVRPSGLIACSTTASISPLHRLPQALFQDDRCPNEPVEIHEAGTCVVIKAAIAPASIWFICDRKKTNWLFEGSLLTCISIAAFAFIWKDNDHWPLQIPYVTEWQNRKFPDVSVCANLVKVWKCQITEQKYQV